MSVVCPTVTAKTVDEFHGQLDTVCQFSERIHIDLADGKFASQLIPIEEIKLPESVETDIHLMFVRNLSVLPQLIALQPSLVIVHSEANDDFRELSRHLKQHGIAFGISLLQKTAVAEVTDLVKMADHVLIFSGNLGSFGGTADLSLLRKVSEIKQLNPAAEIGWDGGINHENIHRLAAGGIDVCNVGGAIQKAMRPENMYRDLQRRALS